MEACDVRPIVGARVRGEVICNDCQTQDEAMLTIMLIFREQAEKDNLTCARCANPLA